MQYSFATAYDLSSSDTVGGPYTLTNVTTPRSIAFSDNGKKLFVGDDAATEIIHQFNLTTAWDASTIVSQGWLPQIKLQAVTLLTIHLE